MNTPPPERISVFKPTADPWYPAYMMNGRSLVKVTFLEFIDHSGWRVHIWGADDDGMERDWNTRSAAYEMFEKIIRQPEVNKAFLSEQGFSSA